MFRNRIGKNYSGLFEFCEYIKSKYDTKNLTICEIGTFSGESAGIFSKYFKTVTCIDSWSIENAQGNMKECIKEAELIFDELVKKHNNIIKIKGNSLDVVKNVDMFDVVYIDGNHEYKNVKADIQEWKNKARIIISGHDYRKNVNEDVIKAVNEAFGKPDKVFPDWSWIVKRG